MRCAYSKGPGKGVRCEDTAAPDATLCPFHEEFIRSTRENPRGGSVEPRGGAERPRGGAREPHGGVEDPPQ